MKWSRFFMKNKKVTEGIHLLAGGVHPQTGVAINNKSELNDPYIIRLLYRATEILSTAHEIQFNKDVEPEDNSKYQNNLIEKRRLNIGSGRPARSNFRYKEEERSQIITKFEKGKTIQELAQEFERSNLAIAIQLHNADSLSDEMVKLYRYKKIPDDTKCELEKSEDQFVKQTKN